MPKGSRSARSVNLPTDVDDEKHNEEDTTLAPVPTGQVMSLSTDGRCPILWDDLNRQNAVLSIACDKNNKPQSFYYVHQKLNFKDFKLCPKTRLPQYIRIELKDIDDSIYNALPRDEATQQLATGSYHILSKVKYPKNQHLLAALRHNQSIETYPKAVLKNVENSQQDSFFGVTLNQTGFQDYYSNGRRNFRGVTLQGAFGQTNFHDVDLSYANLSLSSFELADADATGRGEEYLNLTHARLGPKAFGAFYDQGYRIFRKVILLGDFRDIEFSDVIFYGGNLIRATFGEKNIYSPLNYVKLGKQQLASLSKTAWDKKANHSLTLVGSFKGFDFNGFNLKSYFFEYANFTGADLSNIESLNRNDFPNYCSDDRGLSLDKQAFQALQSKNAFFNYSKLQLIGDFSDVLINNFRGAYIRGALLAKNNKGYDNSGHAFSKATNGATGFNKVKLTGADISEEVFRTFYQKGQRNFNDIKVKHARFFKRVNFSGVFFMRADLRNIINFNKIPGVNNIKNLNHAILTPSQCRKLHEVNRDDLLQNVILMGTIRNANFSGMDLTKINFDKVTNIINTPITQAVIGLELFQKFYENGYRGFYKVTLKGSSKITDLCFEDVDLREATIHEMDFDRYYGAIDRGKKPINFNNMLLGPKQFKFFANKLQTGDIHRHDIARLAGNFKAFKFDSIPFKELDITQLTHISASDNIPQFLDNTTKIKLSWKQLIIFLKNDLNCATINDRFLRGDFIFTKKDEQKLVKTFKCIYKALYKGERRWYKSKSFVEKLETEDNCFLSTIRMHIQGGDGGGSGARSRRAWNIMLQYYRNDKKHEQLFRDVYSTAYRYSGFFKRSCFTGKTIFKASTLDTTFKIQDTEFKLFAQKSKISSRSHCIEKELQGVLAK